MQSIVQEEELGNFASIVTFSVQALGFLGTSINFKF